MVDRRPQVDPPSDRKYLALLSFFVLGSGIFMPWSLLIMTEQYFTSYKLGPEYLGRDAPYASFLYYAIYAAQITNWISNCINCFIHYSDYYNTRIVGSGFLQVFIIFLTVHLAATDTHEWPGIFFWFTIICIVFYNIFNGIYQSTIFSMAAKFPIQYTAAVFLGSNIHGICDAIANILSNTFMPNITVKISYHYFITLFILVICLSNYIVLLNNKYYKHYRKKEQRYMAAMKYHSSGIPYYDIFKRTLPQLFNIFFVFLVTLSLFPAVQAKVKLSNPGFWITSQLYTSVTCFFTFYMAASVGCFLTFFIIRPSPKYLVIPVVMRVVLIPLFLLSNYHTSDNLNLRMMPIWITNDWVYWIISITMGGSNGYLSSLAMIYVSRSVEEKYATIAGLFGAAALAAGFFCGILISFIWPTLINADIF